VNIASGLAYNGNKIIFMFCNIRMSMSCHDVY